MEQLSVTLLQSHFKALPTNIGLGWEELPWQHSGFLILRELVNFHNVNLSNSHHAKETNCQKCHEELLGHFMVGFTFWQVDFLEVDHFS
jgi:hypothetical protein